MNFRFLGLYMVSLLSFLLHFTCTSLWLCNFKVRYDTKPNPRPRPLSLASCMVKAKDYHPWIAAALWITSYGAYKVSSYACGFFLRVVRLCSIANGGFVCPSVTLVIHALTVQDIETNFAPHDRTMYVVSWGQISWSWDSGVSLEQENYYQKRIPASTLLISLCTSFALL